MFYVIFSFLVFYLSLGVAISPAQDIDLSSIRILILVIFLLWLMRGLIRKYIYLGNNFQTILIISFLFLAVFSFFFSQNGIWAGRKILFLLSIFPIFFVASDIFREKEKAIKSLWLILFGGLITALLGILQFFLQFVFSLEKVYSFWSNWIVIPFLGRSFSQAVLENPSWLVNIGGKTFLRATATFPDPHMFSFFLGMLFFLSIGLYLKNRKKIIWIFISIFLLADLLTFSRGGYLGLLAGLSFLIFGLILIEKKIRFAGIVSLILLILVIFFPSPISNRLSSSFDFREGSNAGRIETWKKAGDVLVQNPFGVGIGNYPLKIKPTADYREPIYAHNAYLDISLESGILNGIIWISIIFYSFFLFYKRAKKDKFFWGLSAAILGFSVHSLVELPLYSVAVLPLFLIVLSFSSYGLSKKNK